MSESILSQDYLKSRFKYEDGNLTYLYGARRGKQLGTAINTNGYRRTNLFGKAFYVHQLIYLFHHGYIPKIIDHINQNKLDNKIENLREASKSQNALNSKVNKRSISGVKGVSKHPKGSTWIAKITIGNKPKHLGCYKTIEEAQRAVEAARADQLTHRYNCE